MDGSSPFGHLLRDLRVRQGMSLAQLSQLTHYSKGYLSRVENGHRQPSAQLASQCEAMLGAAWEGACVAGDRHGRLAVSHPFDDAGH